MVADAEAARREEKKRKGLAVLNETHEGKYKIDEFKKLRNALTDYLKNTIKSDHVSEDQLPHLETALIRLSLKPSRDEKKKKLWEKRDSFIWTFIEGITSKDFSDRIFSEINNK